MMNVQTFTEKCEKSLQFVEVFEKLRLFFRVGFIS